MKRKIHAKGILLHFGLSATEFYPAFPREVDEIYYYVDDISGDGRGIS